MALPVSMLAGWGATAAGVNAASMLVGKGLVAEGHPERSLAAVTTGMLGVVGVTGVRGCGSHTFTARAFGGTVLWALSGLAAAQRTRFRVGAAAATVGIGAVGAALVAGPRRTRET